MNFSKLSLALFACLFVHFQLYSQDHNPDGYYISLKGDTIHGKFVDYPEYSRSPTAVSFQPSSSAEVITLTPDKCLKFSVGGSDTYVSYQGRRLVNETNYQLAPTNLPDEYEDVSAFLRELFNDGHYRLYELNDKKRTNFYISSDTMPMKELLYKVYLEDGNVVESTVFRQQLSFIFIDLLDQKPGAQKTLEKLNYTDVDLIKFLTAISNGKRTKQKEKYPSEFFVGIGASVNRFNATGDNTRGNNIVSMYSSQVTPVLEAGIKIFNQRNHGKIFVTARINAYQYKNWGSSSNYIGDITTDTFKATVISFPVSIGYKLLSNSDISLSVSAGLAFLLLNDNVQDGHYESGRLPFHFNNSTSAVVTEYGEVEAAWKKKLSLYTGYYFPTSVGNFVGYTPNHSSIKFGVRYVLF